MNPIPRQPSQPRNVAVVGSGISGLTAAHVLTRAGHRVTLFETDTRLGGHTHSHDVDDGSGPTLSIDTGFIVYNERTYPLLTRLFAELGVDTRPCSMGMSVSCDGCGLEYAGRRGIRGLFPHRSNVRGAYLRMLVEIRRFHRAAQQFLTVPHTEATDLSLGEFALAHRLTDYFRAHFLVPMVSAVWSCAPDTAMEYPARYLFRFLDNHGMLAIRGAAPWRTVVGGSRTYVDRIAKDVHDVRLATPVSSVRTTERQGHVRTADGDEATFDAVVIATHADQALSILAAPTSLQRRVLGAFGYSRNVTVLHTDARRLPASRRAWASWNYRLPSCSADFAGAQVSYYMNSLQGLDATHDYVVTLNDTETIDTDQVIATMVYEHPVYTREAVAAQSGLADLGNGVIAFAGAHHGWGFHEDGCRAGVDAARSLGADW
jgi:predicted NAD/FAD-binding protein